MSAGEYRHAEFTPTRLQDMPSIGVLQYFCDIRHRGRQKKCVKCTSRFQPLTPGSAPVARGARRVRGPENPWPILERRGPFIACAPPLAPPRGPRFRGRRRRRGGPSGGPKTGASPARAGARGERTGRDRRGARPAQAGRCDRRGRVAAFDLEGCRARRRAGNRPRAAGNNVLKSAGSAPSSAGCLDAASGSLGADGPQPQTPAPDKGLRPGA